MRETGLRWSDGATFDDPSFASDGADLPEGQRRGWGTAKSERRTVAVLVLLVVEIEIIWLLLLACLGNLECSQNSHQSNILH
jgi:hypothetical protein